MKLQHAFLVVLLLAGTGRGQPRHTATLPARPVAFVRSLYQQVVARHPSGIPSGADQAVFFPYLSMELVKRIERFNACVADWNDKHYDPDQPEKAPFGIFESGMFSGGNERTSPHLFHIERSQRVEGGDYEITVKLTWRDDPPSHYWDNWRVKVILVPESERLALDEVVYLGDRTRNEPDWTLTRSLTDGCDGPHWVGYGAFKPIPPLRQRAMWVR